MIEKLTTRRQERKQKREEKKNKAKIENYLNEKYWNVRKFFDDYFYKYMAILKNTKQRFLQLCG